MNTPRQDQLAIAQEAAHWFTALEDGDVRDHTAFAQWIQRSPLHVQEFLNITAVHRLFEGIDPHRKLDVRAWLTETPNNVIALPQARASAQQRTGKPGHKSWLAGIAAALAPVAVSIVWWSARVGWEDYRTPVGEQRSVELSDGSLVHLSAQSHLRILFNETGRELKLMEGEALFTVQRDSARPFRVHAGEAVIQALGTQFNVNRRTRDTAVAVIEGSVRISGANEQQTLPLLVAGEKARIAQDGVIFPPQKIDAARVASWRERRLVFQSDTLEDMAAEFNRYNRSPQIRIDGDEVKQRRFTGVLDANHPESLLSLLTETDDLAFERRAEEIVISTSAGARAPHR